MMGQTGSDNVINIPGKGEIKLGLERIEGLMHQLGDPQDKLRFIHVAGTNGKGSACAFLSAILSANGYKVGTYTSPAVEDVREQYVINGEWISAEDYAACAARVCAAELGLFAPDEREQASSDDAAIKDSPTEFEVETAMAFLYFYEKGCDYVVLETGLGGRGDATNIVKKTVLSVLTSISEDHLGMIGNNIEEIAYTKAGIVKPGVPVVMMENTPEVEAVIRSECDKCGSKLTVVRKEDIVIQMPDYDPDTVSNIRNENKDACCTSVTYKDHRNIKLGTAGSYQADNAALALEALNILRETGEIKEPDEDLSKEALSKVYMPYRMEKISEAPLFYVDGAHNPDAARRLRESILRMFPHHKRIFIMGVFRDKEYDKVAAVTAPLADMIITVETPESQRALPAEELRLCVVDQLRDLAANHTHEPTPGTDVKIPDGTMIEDMVCAVKDISRAVKLSINRAEEMTAQGHDVCIIAFGSLSYLKYVKACFRK